MQQEHPLFHRPVLLVIVRQLKIKTPKDLAQDEIHLSPCQPLPFDQQQTIQRCLLQHLRLSETIPWSYHKWLVHLFSILVILASRVLKPPLRSERVRFNEIKRRPKHGFLRDSDTRLQL